MSRKDVIKNGMGTKAAIARALGMSIQALSHHLDKGDAPKPIGGKFAMAAVREFLDNTPMRLELPEPMATK